MDKAGIMTVKSHRMVIGKEVAFLDPRARPTTYGLHPRPTLDPRPETRDPRPYTLLDYQTTLALQHVRY
eukprot:3376795-Rhodomonas_salina.1